MSYCIGDQTVYHDLHVEHDQLVGWWLPLFGLFPNFFASSIWSIYLLLTAFFYQPTSAKVFLEMIIIKSGYRNRLSDEQTVNNSTIYKISHLRIRLIWCTQTFSLNQPGFSGLKIRRSHRPFFFLDLLHRTLPARVSLPLLRQT